MDLINHGIVSLINKISIIVPADTHTCYAAGNYLETIDYSKGKLKVHS